MFVLQSSTPKNDFCRLFVKCGALSALVRIHSLATVGCSRTHSIVWAGQDSGRYCPRQGRAVTRRGGLQINRCAVEQLVTAAMQVVDILQLFSHGDATVKNYFADEAEGGVLQSMFRFLPLCSVA